MKRFPRIIYSAFIASSFPFVSSFSNSAYSKKATRLSVASVAIDTPYERKTNGLLLETHVKPSKILSVCVEYNPSDENDQLSSADLSALSMQLRQTCKATSIWTHEIASISSLVKEQKIGGEGNFPGPCPIVYYNDNKQSGSDETEREKQAIETGVSAVVIDANDFLSGDEDVDSNSIVGLIARIIEKCKEIDSHGVEIIWKVESKEQVDMIMKSGFDDAFLIPDFVEYKEGEVEGNDDNVEISENNNLDDLISILSPLKVNGSDTEKKKKIMIVSSVLAMQPKNKEVKIGKYLQNKIKKSFGRSSNIFLSCVLVKDACIGDDEDITYSSFVVDQLRSKASSEFQMTGLTGSTNGHFGGVAQKGETFFNRETKN